MNDEQNILIHAGCLKVEYSRVRNKHTGTLINFPGATTLLKGAMLIYF